MRFTTTGVIVLLVVGGLDRGVRSGAEPESAAEAATLAWSSEDFEDFVHRPGYGHVPRGWSPWFVDANPALPGSREWNIVPGESGWGQELRKSNVRMGLLRLNSGFAPGATYRIGLRARWLSGAPSPPQCHLGVHPEGGTDPDGVQWSEGTEVTTRDSWTDVSAVFTVPSPSATVFVEVDYSGVHDYGVAIDDLLIEPVGDPGNLPPTVSLSTDVTTALAPGTFVLSAAASDADGSISRVEFYEGSVLLHTDTTPPFSHTWSDVPVGSYSLSAAAWDEDGASATSAAVPVSVTSGPPTTTTDPGLVWLSDHMDTHDGRLVRRWSPWSAGDGSAEWRIVPGEGGWWAQEVRKTNVDVGVSRANRGFRVGDAYRLRFRARRTGGQGTPLCYAGVASEGEDPVWGLPAAVTSTTDWVDVELDFTASSWTGTVFLRADLSGLADVGVAFDNVSVELLSPRDPEPWMISGAPPAEPPNIHGIHDTGAEDLFVQADRRGWVTEALAIGSDPEDHSGHRFTQWIDGIGVVGRIAHSYGQILPDPGPAPDHPGLDAFARRCANFVESSVGCGIWSIGNEPHLEGVPDPALYAEAFTRCYRAIKAVRPGAKVITAGFVHGDLNYFESALAEIERRGIVPDGIALHTYTDSQGWNETSFRDYQLKIAHLPPSMTHLPLYITEAGTGGPGNPTTDTGLIDAMFDHVHRWNAAGGQQLRAVCVYRWTAGADKWSIEDNPGMRADFVGSLAQDYRWFDEGPDNLPPTVSLSTDTVRTSAPGTFVMTASASDPDGSVARVEFDQGGTLLATDSVPPFIHAWEGVGVGVYSLSARAYDELGAWATSNVVSVSVEAPPVPGNLVTNGDFSGGLSGWTSWTERGSLNATVGADGRLHIASGNHNGGLYQQFSTGGAGRRIDVAGLWGSDPTRPDYQWAEVLVIDGSDLPVEGRDIVGGQTLGQSRVVLLYKSETWGSPTGWSGAMGPSLPASFTASDDVATLVLKSGNLGSGLVSGTWFDDVEVRESAGP